MSKSSTITKKNTPRPKKLPAIHPGEILREEFLRPLGLSMNALALALRVPVPRVAEIVHERRSITPDTALRLARYFDMSARFWLNLQSLYDLEVAEDRLAHKIAQHVQPYRPPDRSIA
jgi:addiction module HigA family antidote